MFAALKMYITNPDDQGDRVIRWMQPKKGFINVRMSERWSVTIITVVSLRWMQPG